MKQAKKHCKEINHGTFVHKCRRTEDENLYNNILKARRTKLISELHIMNKTDKQCMVLFVSLPVLVEW